MATDIGARIGLDGLASFRQASNLAVQQAKNLEAQMKALTAQFGTADKSEQALTARNKVLSDSLNQAKERSSLYKNELDKQSATLQKLAGDVERLTKEHGENSDEVEKAKSAYASQAIEVEKIGQKYNGAEADVNKFSRELDENESALNDVKRGFNDAGQRVDEFGNVIKETESDVDGFGKKGSSSIKDLVVSLGLLKVATAIFDQLKNSVSAAVERIDTLNRFPKIIEQWGYSAGEAEAATQKLSDGIQGLPTTLDGISASARQLVSATGDLSTGVDTALALNNAFYASGASADEASRGMVQYTQMLSSGKVDMQSWKTLNETMTYALQKTAEAFGFTGRSAKNDLYAALQSGQITFDQFNAKIVELDSGVNGFAATAKTATGGIGTSIANMNTAITRGVGNIIKSFDEMTGLQGGIQKFGKAIESVLTTVAENLDVIIPLVLGAVAAFASFKIINSIIPIINSLKASVAGIGKFFKEFNSAVIAMKAGVEGAAESVKKMNAAMATTVIGAVVAGVTALLAVIDALSNRVDGWQKKLEESNAKAEDQIQTNESLLESLRSIDTEYEKNIAQADNAATSSQNLLDRITELQAGIKSGTTAVEDQTAAQREISRITTQLNSDVENLGLKYDETTNSLNMSADAVEKAIDKQKEYQKAIAGMEQAVRLAEMQQDAEDELYMTKSRLADKQKELTDLQNGLKWNASAVDIWDWGKAVKDATDATEGLAEQQGELDGELGSIKQRIQEALNGMVKYIREVETSQEISDQMTDKEISNIQALIDAGGELSAADTEKFNIIKSNRAREIVQQEDYVQAIKDGNVAIGESEAAALEQRRVNGEELTEVEQAKLDRWNEIAEEYKQSVDATTDDIINSWKKLPDEYDLTLDEMMEIGNENAERYQEWSQKMAYLSQYMSEESIAALKELGPGATSVLDELIIGGSEKMTEFDDMMIGKVQGTAENSVNGITAITPAVIEAFNQMNSGVGLKMDELGNILDAKTGETVASAAQVLNGETLPESARNALDKVGQAISESESPVAAAKEKGDQAGTEFGAEYGKSLSTNEAPNAAANEIAANVAQSLANADYSTITTGIANAITAGKSNIDAAMSSVVSGMQTTLNTVHPKMTTSATTAMTNIVTAIKTAGTGSIRTAMTNVVNTMYTALTSGISRIRTAATSLVNAIMTTLNQLPGKVGTTGTQVMNTLADELGKSGSVTSAIRGTMGGVVSTIRGYFDSMYSAMGYLMRGMVDAMKDYAPQLYAQARTIANNISNTLRKAWKEHSPSKVSFGIMGYYMKGLLNSMIDGAKDLYRMAETMSDKISDKLTFETEITPLISDVIPQALSAVENGIVVHPEYHTATQGAYGDTIYIQPNITLNTKGELTKADLKRAAEYTSREIARRSNL